MTRPCQRLRKSGHRGHGLIWQAFPAFEWRAQGVIFPRLALLRDEVGEAPWPQQ
jgi:hypothetical protein